MTSGLLLSPTTRQGPSPFPPGTAAYCPPQSYNRGPVDDDALLGAAAGGPPPLSTKVIQQVSLALEATYDMDIPRHGMQRSVDSRDFHGEEDHFLASADVFAPSQEKPEELDGKGQLLQAGKEKENIVRAKAVEEYPYFESPGAAAFKLESNKVLVLPTSERGPAHNTLRAPSRSKLQKKMRMLQKKNQCLKQRKRCRACRKMELAESGVTFLPCGHFITCEVCSEKFDDCPACGKSIMGTVRTFLS